MATIFIEEENGLWEEHVCPQCNGAGYHHGFGERGMDPDWCTLCGGPGVGFHELLTPYET